MSLKIYDKEGKAWKKATSMLAGSLKVIDGEGNFDSENVEGCLKEIAKDMTEMKSHIKYIYQNGTIGGGPGGGSSAPTIKLEGSPDADGVYRRIVKSDEDVEFYYFFNSPNPGSGKVRLASGDKVVELVKSQGRHKWSAGKFKRGKHYLSISVEDQQGFVSEPARIEIISGAIELSSTFSDAKDFSSADELVIPYRIETDLPEALTVEYKLNETITEEIIPKGDQKWTIGMINRPGVYKAEIRVKSNSAISNVLKYTLVVTDSESIFVSTNFDSETHEQGKRLQFSYRISMRNQYMFKTERWLDGVKIDTVDDTLGYNFWDLGSDLPLGERTLKVVCMTTDKQQSATLEVKVNIIEAGLIEIIEPSGMIAKFSADGKSNDSSSASVWEDKSGNKVACTLHGFNYITNGWMVDEASDTTALTFAGNSYAEIDLAPFKDGIDVGFTFDIVFKSTDTGNADARVAECKNPLSPYQGFMIDTEKAIMEAKQGVRAFYDDRDWTRITITVDRLGRTMRTYTNATISSATIIGEKNSAEVGQPGYEVDEFLYPGKILLGAGRDLSNNIINNSTSMIKMIRIYNRPLTDKEVLDVHMYDIKNSDELDAIWNLNYGERTIPTLDISGVGADNMKPGGSPITVAVQYSDPLRPEKSLNRFYCELDIQGTTSQFYPTKNYTLFMRNERGEPDRVWTPRDEWMADERWTLKTNFMDSSHANNVGIAKMAHEIFKENPYPQQLGDKGRKRRSTVDGFPVAITINGKDAGIYTFNIDRYAHNSYGLIDVDDKGNVTKVNRAVQYEVAVNSTSGAGAFNNTSWDSISREFKHRYNHRDGDMTIDIGGETVLNAGMHKELENLVNWVFSADDEAFKQDVSKWWSLPHLIDYYLITYAFGMVDNLGKNMVLTTFGANDAGHTIWYPSFYDCDSILGLANNGEVKYDAGVDMGTEGVFNSRTSALWVKLNKNFSTEIMSRYIALRAVRPQQDGSVLPPIFSSDYAMSFFDGEIMKYIGQSKYNDDANRKYIDGRELIDMDNPDAARPGQSWIGSCNGSRKEFSRRWIEERFRYLDSVYQVGIYNAKTMILRTNVIGPVKLRIKSYSPQWFKIQYTSTSFVKIYASRDRDYEFELNMTNADDNDFTIFGADNLMYLRGMELLEVSHINAAGADRLVEINCSNSKKIKGIQLESNTYLQMLIANDCPSLGIENTTKNINLSGCKNLKKVDLSNTKIKEVTLNKDGGVINDLNLKNSLIERLNINGQMYLKDLQVGGCLELSTIALSKCNGLEKVSMPKTILSSVSISQCENIKMIDISDTARLESLDLRGCPELIELNLTGVASRALKDLDLTASLKLEKLIIRNMPFIECITFGRYTDSNNQLQNFRALKHFDCNNSSIKVIRYGLGSSMPTDMDLAGLSLDFITFERCPNIVNVKNINLVASGSMAPFRSCKNLESITGNVVLRDNIDQAFYDCNKLTNISKNILNKSLVLDLSRVTRMSETFYICRALTMDDLRAIMNTLSTSLTGSTWRCFGSATNIKGQLPSDLFSKVTEMRDMNEFFISCNGITGTLHKDLFKPMTKLNNCRHTFSGCTGITGEIPNEFFVGPGASLTSLQNTFSGCSGLTMPPSATLLASNVNLSNASWLFNGCSGITGKVPGAIFNGLEKLTDIRGFFNGCVGIWGEIPRNIFRHCRNSNNSQLKYVSNFFAGTSVEGEIPAFISDSDRGIFDEIPYLEEASYVFPRTISGRIPSGLFKNNPRLTDVNGLFDGCVLIEGEIPESLLKGKDKLRSVSKLFKGCIGINSTIPRKLFEGCTVLSDVSELFSGCKSLAGKIPERTYVAGTETVQEYGLFDYCESMVFAAGVFAHCEKLTGHIPPEIFKSAKLVKDLSSAFYRCFGITGDIPRELFENCINLEKANSMFGDCVGLGRTPVSITPEDPYCIPPELFENCRKLMEVSGFFNMWGPDKPRGSSLIGEVPPTMFRNNRELRNVSSFFTATTITGEVPGNLFLTNGELTTCATMFAASNVTSVGSSLLKANPKIKTVTEMFWQASGISGDVPALWEIGGLEGARCYNGLSSSKVTNWADIPVTWK